MNPAFLQNEFVVAMCWTLIHSLWQGMILATITGAVLLATKRSHARRRYTILTVLFFMFVTATIVTFLRELQLASPSGISPLAPETLAQRALTAQVEIGQSVQPVESSATFWQRCTAYFNTHASTVVMIWLIIFMARLVKLIGNLVYVQRLRSYRTAAPGVEWTEKLRSLITKLGIRKQVKLLESGIVKVPVTMGVFKPVILLPLGLLNHLPSDEIEAILLHELAHIRRSDYFINLLQSLAETIFFFNPALLWLSSMMREERENCCDDIAISVTNSKTQFINALISFQEYHYAQPAMGLAFPGSKHQLLNRVKRIVHNRNKTLNAAEKSILSLGIAFFIMFSFVAAKKIPQRLPGQPAVVKQSPDKLPAPSTVGKILAAPRMLTDTALPAAKKGADVVIRDPVAEQRVVPDRNADLAPLRELRTINDKFREVRDTIPTSNYTHFSTSINDDGKMRIVEMTATSKDGKEYKFKKVNGEIKELSVNGKTIPEAEYKNYQQEIDEIELIHQYKMEQSRRRREEMRIKREMSEDLRHQMIEQKMQHLKENRQLDMIKRQQELELRRHSMEEKRHVQKDMLLKEKERLLKEKRITLNKEMQLDIQNKANLLIKQNHAANIKYDYKVHIDPRTKLKIYEMINSKHADSVVLKQKLELLHRDSLKLKMHPERLAALRKQEFMRARAAEDQERIKVSAAVMRGILEDLAQENIKVDNQRGWFALDNDKFIVDGQPMTAALHEKFRAKYVKTNGWGYYYGDVKVTGRGIFLDNKDVPAR